MAVGKRLQTQTAGRGVYKVTDMMVDHIILTRAKERTRVEGISEAGAKSSVHKNQKTRAYDRDFHISSTRTRKRASLR